MREHRRQFLNQAAMGVGGLALGTMLASAKPHHKAKAKQVIWLYMDGGLRVAGGHVLDDADSFFCLNLLQHEDADAGCIPTRFAEILERFVGHLERFTCLLQTKLAVLNREFVLRIILVLFHGPAQQDIAEPLLRRSVGK